MLNYVLGIVTPMLLVALWLILGELTRRNLVLECGTCDKRFGVLPSEAEEYGGKPTFTYVTRLRLKLHHIKCK